MSLGVILRWALLALAVVGLIRVTRDEFGLSLDDYLDAVVKFVDNVVEPFAEILRPWITNAFDWLRERTGWQLTLQYHWIYAYALMQLFFGSYATSISGEGRSLRIFLSFLFSLVFGILAGTVHLAHTSVLFYPMAGFLLFVAVSGAFDAATESGVSQGTWWRRFGFPFLLPGIVLVAAAAFSPLQLSLFPGTSKSFGLLLLLSGIFLIGIFLLLFGFPGQQHSGVEGALWRTNPSTRMGLRILLVLCGAWALVTLSQYRERSTVRVATVPIQEVGGFRDCKEDYCPLMRPIMAGEFDMGSDAAELAFATSLGAKPEDIKNETPRHKVAVRQFALSVTEVTRGQFEAFVKERHYKPEGFCFGVNAQLRVDYGGLRNWQMPGFLQDDDHPAVCVTWWDAKAYTDFLSRVTGHKYRLPSEAEWEYAARAGTTTSRYWGQENSMACEYANVWDVNVKGAFGTELPKQGFPCNDGYSFTSPVAKYRANAFGLHDMLGNVWEWIDDCYHASYTGAQSSDFSWPLGNCNHRVFRGGAWASDPVHVRSADRDWDLASSRYSDAGFRVARTE